MISMLHDITFEQVIFVLELLGVVVCGISGALSAIERDMDLFGMLVLACIAALGGGFIRDILVDRFPVSLGQPSYFLSAIAGVLLAVPAMRATARTLRWLKIFDALGLAIFSILGAQVGLQYQLNFLSVLLLGVLTGIGGGVLRDILANEIPLVLRQEVYALASIIGITLLWLLVRFTPLTLTMAVGISITVIFCIRLSAIHWGLNLPRIQR